MQSNITLGVIIGNRGFFPDHLCGEGRKTILEVLKSQGIEAVILDDDTTKIGGAIETLIDARKCADLFKKHADKIDGILITLPNFGDERAIANAIRWSGLNVPVLVHAFPDVSAKMDIAFRRDSFCGKMSACNNLRQYGIPFSLTSLHTMDPTTDAFKSDLQKFAATCRAVRSLTNLRVGMIGARPAAFNTVRFSEKLLEQSGISVETLDLSELTGWANKMKDTDAAVKEKLALIQGYTETKGIPEESLYRMVKLGVGIDQWVEDKQLNATAIQCWTSLEEFYGVVPCTLMSMMSNNLMSSACETDIMGVLGMHVLAAATGTPSALLDWNNNYGDDPDKGVVFHCSNLPKEFFVEHRMDFQEIIAGSVGKENTYGTIVGRIKPGPFTYCRLSTDDFTGEIMGYVGEGEVCDQNLRTFGGFGVVKINEFQKLLKFICENGFEHHVAMNLNAAGDAVYEALTKYKGWAVYQHES